MRYVSFGNTGTELSELVLGAMRVANMDASSITALLEAADEVGINMIDLADIYGGGGTCEEKIGAALLANPAFKEKFWIQSKVGIRREKGDTWFDFSKDYIVSAVEGSLKRLQTDHLDSLLLHRPDVLMEPEEVAAAFDELHNQGKVRYFGVSNQNPATMQQLQAACDMPLVCNQIQLSPVHTPVLDAVLHANMSWDSAVMRDGGILEYCRAHHMAVQAWSPLQIGYFEGNFVGSDRYAQLNQVLRRLATKYEVTPEAIVFAWILRIPGQMQVVTGTTSPNHLRKGAKAADVELSRQEFYELYKAAGNRLP